jgi:hypothetical protein
MANTKTTQTGHTVKEKGNLRKSQKDIDKHDVARGNEGSEGNDLNDR